MGKRSRQRQKNQTAGRDSRDNAVRVSFLLRQLLLMFDVPFLKCSVATYTLYLNIAKGAGDEHGF